MIISLTSISAILMVVIFLTTNITPSNGSLVKNGKNDTSLNNLMALLISNGGGSVNKAILILTLIAAIRFKDKINKIIV